MADLSEALALSATEARARADAPLQQPRAGNNTGAAQAREILGPPLRHHFGHRDGRWRAAACAARPPWTSSRHSGSR